MDDFAPPNGTYDETERVVERTINWAAKSKTEYQKLLKKNGITEKSRPKLFSVIQGGYHKKLRKRCAEELVKIGFDGYGFGGYVINETTGELDLEISEYVADLIPDDAYRFALGFGRPNDIVALHKMGWEIFDCTLPTRDARHKRLYVFNEDPEKIDFTKDETFYSYLYINKVEHQDSSEPISPFCDCLTCTNNSRAYLHHLFKIKDSTAFRLATIHNLRFYTRLIERLM